MDMKDELNQANRYLDAAHKIIDSQSVEIKQLNLIFDVLERAGHITDGKLEEARGFVQRLFSDKP